MLGPGSRCSPSSRHFCRRRRRNGLTAATLAHILIALLPNLILTSAFTLPATFTSFPGPRLSVHLRSESTTSSMENKSERISAPSYIRRTSSLAYDASSLNSDRSHNQPNQHRPTDAWRERWNLPPSSVKRSSVKSALSPAIRENETINIAENNDTNAKPLYTFGILTDIQYAPIPDGTSYNGTPRNYRHALTAAEHAARHFEEEQVHCVVNLGDIVDGKCADVEKWGGSLGLDKFDIAKINDSNVNEGSEEKKSNNYRVGHDAIDNVVKALSSYKSGKVLHTYGNHELYNLSREELGEKLNIPFTLEPTGDLVGYYSYALHDKKHGREEQSLPDPIDPTCDTNSSNMKLRFLLLDTYDISILDRCPNTSPKRQLAHELLSANNHNYPHNENSPEGLDELSKRFVAFNGGIDKIQLKWLEQSLQSAKENNEKVIIFSHQPIHPGSSGPICLVWNYSEVLSVIRKFNDVVIASFSGHAHKGGYARDEESGIHFRTLEAVLESPDPVRTYGMIDLWKDRLEVRGWGDCMSDIYDLDHLHVSKNCSD